MEAESESLDVRAIEAAVDAEARLRVASAHLFAVSDWLAQQHRWDSRAGDWCDVADRLGHDARTLAQRIRMADDDHQDE